MVTERDERGRFVAGHAGKSPGRPKGLAERCRCATRDGVDAVEFYLDVANGKLPRVTIDQRMQAWDWLIVRGWGRAQQQVDVTSGGKILRIVIDGSDGDENDH